MKRSRKRLSAFVVRLDEYFDERASEAYLYVAPIALGSSMPPHGMDGGRSLGRGVVFSSCNGYHSSTRVHTVGSPLCRCTLLSTEYSSGKARVDHGGSCRSKIHKPEGI